MVGHVCPLSCHTLTSDAGDGGETGLWGAKDVALSGDLLKADSSRPTNDLGRVPGKCKKLYKMTAH